MLVWRSTRIGRPSYSTREDQVLELTPEVAGYTAGILDGEGCITLALRKGKTPTTLIAVGNTDYRLLAWLRGHFGGFIRLVHPATEKQKTVWHWHLTTIEARRLLRSVKQYLVIKQRHAEVILSFQEALRARQFRRQLVQPFPEPFASLFDEIRSLNRKGPPSH